VNEARVQTCGQKSFTKEEHSQITKNGTEGSLIGIGTDILATIDSVRRSVFKLVLNSEKELTCVVTR